jgi:6-phosphofructokinase 1
MQDKRSNPSHYAMVTVSEGAKPMEGDILLSGKADAFGHRKLGGIGQQLSEALHERTGEDMIYQPLAYLMRSGSPDSLDLMVATNYAVMAADLAVEKDTGRMVSLRSGTYTTVPISATREGVKRVDVDELYDSAEYRPKVRHVLGKPMFLY